MPNYRDRYRQLKENIAIQEHQENVLTMKNKIQQEKQQVEQLQAQNRYNKLKNETQSVPIKDLEKMNKDGKLNQVIMDRKIEDKVANKIVDTESKKEYARVTGDYSEQKKELSQNLGVKEDLQEEVIEEKSLSNKERYLKLKESLPKEEVNDDKGIVERVGERLKKAGELTKEAFTDRDIFPILGQRQLLGASAEIARAIQDVSGEAFYATAKGISKITPDIIEEPVKRTIKKIGKKALENPVIQKGLQAMQFGMDKYEDFKKSYPEEASILEDAGVVAMTLPFAGAASNFVGKVARPVLKSGKTVATGVVKPLKYTIGKTREVVPKIAKGTKRAIKGVEPIQLLKERISPKQAKVLLHKLQQSGKDGVALLPDIAGDEIIGLTRATARVAGGAKEIISSKLKIRSVNANKRINKALNTFLSNDEYYGNIDDLIAKRQHIAAPFYKEASGKAVTDKRIGVFINDKRFKKALKTAKNNFNLNPDIAENSVEALDAVKKVFDDTISSAMRSGEKQKARAFIKYKNEMLNIIDESVPEYKTARSIFSDYSRLEEAQKLGLSFKSQRPEQLKRIMKTYTTDGEKSAFRLGVKEKLTEIVDKTAEGADPAKRIFGNPETRNSLKQIFDPVEYKLFQKKMIEEIRGARTKFDVLGGSRTDFNMIDLGKSLKDAKDIAKSPRLSTLIDKSLGKFFESIEEQFTGLNPETSKKLAKILTNKEESIKALREIARG